MFQLLFLALHHATCELGFLWDSLGKKGADAQDYGFAWKRRRRGFANLPSSTQYIFFTERTGLGRWGVWHTVVTQLPDGWENTAKLLIQQWPIYLQAKREISLDILVHPESFFSPSHWKVITALVNSPGCSEASCCESCNLTCSSCCTGFVCHSASFYQKKSGVFEEICHTKVTDG